MKHVVANLLLTLTICLAVVLGGEAQKIAHVSKPSLRWPQSLEEFAPHPMGTAQVPASAEVIWVNCPAEAQGFGAICGRLPVPLDREDPRGEKIRIYFELYPHSVPGSAESAILVNFGGPGGGTTTSRDLALTLFQANLDVHDILLIDDRGRGFSGTIDCKELQHGTAPPFSHEVADCAALLGAAASRYGTGDIAQDADAIRAALGYDKVDYFGWSYGGNDVSAYATRFGDHLRSIVLDAPQGVPGNIVFGTHFSTHAMSRLLRLDCLRSPTCSVDHPDPYAELDALIRTVRSSPVEGKAFDANGNLIRVRIGEEALLNSLLGYNPVGNFVNNGEVLAAAVALKEGDPAPILRLGAESIIPLATTDYGNPIDFSIGAGAASLCADLAQIWDWSAPVSEREKKYKQAVAALPTYYFAPFSKSAATELPFNFTGLGCLWWQKPTSSSPVVPQHATYPQVPTLVLDGDMDMGEPLEETRKVAALFPGSIFLPVAEAGHGTFLWSHCAATLESQFIENLQTGDTSCTRKPETTWPAVGRFPLVAADARPAQIDSNGNNQIGLAERKAVTVAVAAATDALQRASIGGGNGVGLRAGTFQTSFDAAGNQTTALTNCAFASDVIANGTVVWGTDRSFTADLTVSRAGTAGGTLHVEGTWQAPGPVGNFKVSGQLGGRQVAVLVPEA